MAKLTKQQFNLIRGLNFKIPYRMTKENKTPIYSIRELPKTYK